MRSAPAHTILLQLLSVSIGARAGDPSLVSMAHRPQINSAISFASQNRLTPHKKIYPPPQEKELLIQSKPQRAECSFASPTASYALAIRGGGTSSSSSSPGAALTFGQNLAGSVFFTFAVIYGLACLVAPDRTAYLFYGYDEDDSSNGEGSAARYLMRLMGSLTTGIGLTSAFAIGSEIKAGPGAIPSTATFDRSIGVGLIPRLLMILYSLEAGIPSGLRLVAKDVIVALIQTLVFLWSMYATVVNNADGGSCSINSIVKPDTIITLDVAFHLLLGPLLFFKPSLLFKSTPSKHEKFMCRMLASYSVMGAALVGALQHPAINALPAVGIAAVIWVSSLAHFTFVRKDVEECGTSNSVHIAMMIIGSLVAIGGLQQYLHFSE